MNVLDVKVRTRDGRKRGAWDVYGIGDPHLDKRQCRQTKLERWRDFIAERDGRGLAICTGDIMDGTMPGHKYYRAGTVRQKHLPEMERYIDDMLETAVQFFTPIVNSGMPLILFEGNHDIRIPGVGFVPMLVRRLNGGTLYDGPVQYAGGEALIRVNASGAHWSIYGAHGTGGGSKPGSKINRALDMERIARADIYIRGHVEEGDIHIVDRYTVPKNGEARLCSRPVAFYTCAGHAAQRVEGVIDYPNRASMPTLDTRIQWLEVHNPSVQGAKRPNAHDGLMFGNDFKG